MAEPAITFRAYHDDGPGNLTPTRVVIHATCPNIGYPGASAAGQAKANAHYFTDPNSGGSAHYVVDIADEQHCAPDSHICWHAPPNPRSVGIEICAEGGNYPLSYTRQQWLSVAVFPALRRGATRTAELCTRFGIPAVRIGPRELVAGAHGICGHVDVSQAWHQSDHSDPGPSFPWPEFMAMVTGAPVAPGNPGPAPPATPAPPAAGASFDLAYGQTSDAVRRLQTWLNATFPSYSVLPTTGFYGDQTTQVVAEFQRRVGIDGDGRNVGPRTSDAMRGLGFRG